MDNETQASQEEVGQTEPVAEQEVESPMPSDEIAEPEEEGQLPEEVSDRTRKEFEKLKGSNKELAEKLKKYESETALNNVFDDLFAPKATRPQVDTSHLSEKQVENIAVRYIDDEGNVNVELLNRTLVEANERAKRAEMEAMRTRESVQKDREQRELQEAYKEHPWLDPKHPSFDRTAFELVRDRIVRNMIEGNKPPLVDVARQVAEVYKPIDVSTAREQAVNDFKETQAKKAQATSVQQGKGQPRQSTSLSDLRERTVRGDTNAIDERLAALTSD